MPLASVRRTVRSHSPEQALDFGLELAEGHGGRRGLQVYDHVDSSESAPSGPAPKDLADPPLGAVTDDGMTHLAAGGDAKTGGAFFIRVVVESRQGTVELSSTAVATEELGALVELVAA